MTAELRRRLRDSDGFRFFLQWLRRPRQIGAVIPSSGALAAALAEKIDKRALGAVVELGPGIGSVTRAMLDAGVDPRHLVAVECNDAFCDLLRERFPGVRIVPGDARTLAPLLREAGVGPVKAIVSSLPLLSLARECRRAVLSQIAEVLAPGGVLIQYTYGPAAPVSRELGAELNLTGERTGWVIANLPPATVWCYRRSGPLPELRQAA